MSAVAGEPISCAHIMGRLQLIANALSNGDRSLASVGAALLRLPLAAEDSAERLAKYLARYNADQPRDRHGRWTDEEDPTTETTSNDTAQHGNQTQS
ncbi:MAG TPA: hypothetical protein VEU47_19185, partial [Candidatus Cybelea sp.]|nr:hypothetical protein [Candidatus Cybelea sp.]